MTVQAQRTRPVLQAAPGLLGLIRGLPPVAMIYVICVALPLFFYAGPLLLSALRLLLLVLIIPLTIQLLRGKYGRLILTDAMFVLFVLWMCASLAQNNPNMVIQNAGSTGIEFLGGYLVGRATIRTRQAFLGLCAFLPLIALVTLPFALLENRTGTPYIVQFIHSLPGVFSVPRVDIPGRMGMERVQNVFAHPIHYGVYCAVTFSMVFIGLKGQIATATRWIVAALVGLGCFLALSSGALIALMLQLFLIAWAFALQGVRTRWWWLLALGILAYIVVDILSDRTPIRVFMSYATFSAHTAYWRGLIFEYGLQNALDNPLFGIGLNDWVRPDWMYGDSMDNYWLVLAVRHGFPAFGLVAVGYIYVLLRVIFRDLSADPGLAQIRRTWALTFVGLTFALCTVHIWTNVHSFVLFLFGAGVWLISEPAEAHGDTSAETGRTPPLPYSRFSKVNP
ncbi:MAG: O-antigen ligase family protein [Pseudomonadota bacterium]